MQTRRWGLEVGGVGVGVGVAIVSGADVGGGGLGSGAVSGEELEPLLEPCCASIQTQFLLARARV